MTWDWDQDQLEDRPLTPNDVRVREGMSPIYDEIFERMYAPKPAKWRKGELLLVAAILVVLAGTVALAYFTGSTK